MSGEKIRVSQLLREGIGDTHQVFGPMYEYDAENKICGACALGAIYLGADKAGIPKPQMHDILYGTKLEGPNPTLYNNVLYYRIFYANEMLKLSREEIADQLEEKGF